MPVTSLKTKQSWWNSETYIIRSSLGSPFVNWIEILANVSSFNEQNTEISDGENEINSELEEENESDYDSDGH